ncbi:MAG: hypothetical protein RLY93_10685 [Sumerlaeia bacterium]
MPRPLCVIFSAALLLLAALPARALLVTPLDGGNLSVEMAIAAPTLEQAKDEAKLTAVLASVGRVYLSEYLTLADPLLTKYIENSAEQYVYSLEILEEDYSPTEAKIKARVFVDYQGLIRDLDEKKFLYRPELKPRFAPFMAEVLDGETTEDGDARNALTLALNALGMRAVDGTLPNPPPSADVASDPFLLDPAIVSAQRAGVEVIISGSANTELTDQRKLYYDDYYFYETTMSASLVRVDTGEILFSAKASAQASDRNAESAQRLSIERAAERVAASLVAQFQEFWPLVVQRQSDYNVLLTGIDDETLGIVMGNLERLGRNAQVFIRKKYDRSAVLAIVFDGPKEELLETLRSTPFPTLSVINPEAEKYFEVQVST